MDSDNIPKSSQIKHFNRKLSETQVNRKRIIQVLDLFNSKYKCKICRKKLRYRADEIIHSKLKHRLKDTQIFCPICDKIFTSYQYLTLHLMVEHLKEKPYGCRLCKRRFYYFISLKRHCNKIHLNKLNNSQSSRCSSPSIPDSPLSNDSKKLNLFDLIDYDNSQIIVSDHNELKSLDAYTKYESFLNKMKLCETIWNGDLNKEAHSLDLINISPLMTTSKSITSINDDDDIDPLFDSTQKKTNEEIFTIITQFNICECKCLKLFKTNSDYLNHYWNAHMSQYKCDSIQDKANENFQCWSCKITFSNKNDQSLTFDSQSDLIKHLQSDHLNEMPFRCSICTDLHFDNLDAVKNHVVIHFTNNDFRSEIVFVFACAHCEQIYSDYDAILDHFIQSSSCNLNSQSLTKRSHSCDDCSDTYLNETAFKIHLDQHKFLKNHEQSKELGGVIIRKTPIFVKNKTNLYSSLKNINLSVNNKKYCIDALVNSIPRKPELQLKPENSSNELKAMKNYDSSNLSNSAFVIPRKKDQFSLNNIYKQTTSSTIKLNSHSIQPAKSSLKCESCGYFFDSISVLDAHKQLHNSFNLKRPYKCHLCQVTFSKADQLSRHMIVHQANEQDSVCQICFSSFSRKQDLDRHLLFHSK